MKRRKEDDFNFKWKLIENYFNAFLVFLFTLLFVYYLIYHDTSYIIIILIGVLVGPVLATLLDKKSHEKRR